jgi:lambda family phage portal protein
MTSPKKAVRTRPGRGAGDSFRVGWWDRLLIGLAPGYGLRRVRARATAGLMARHYEAAQGGRRTGGWYRSISDANAAAGPALSSLRELSRDLRRNNGWAKRAIQAVVNNTIGWGIMPKPDESNARRAKKGLDLWKAWAESTACDFDGRLTFYGLQRLVMETVAEAGECLCLLQPASLQDELPIPLRIQVLEPDFLDTSRDGLVTVNGGAIVQGVEFNAQGRRVAYWLLSQHPGSARVAAVKFESQRIPADRVIHVYRVDRPGQVRGVPWLASAITRLKDFDDFEDAELMQQKIAACFGAFVTDVDGAATPLGEVSTDDRLETLEPGHIEYLPPGKTVEFATPPNVTDHAFTARVLRRIAASVGITYEDLTGDYSQSNFSSARMARLAAYANVNDWRWHMVIPQLCDGVWHWVMTLAMAMNGWAEYPTAVWAPPPLPLLEPDKEGLAYQRLIRTGLMTWGQAVREMGEDPGTQLDEIARYNQELDDRDIVLDIDPRRTNTAGAAQTQAGPADVAEVGQPIGSDAPPAEGDGEPPPPDGNGAPDGGNGAPGKGGRLLA